MKELIFFEKQKFTQSFWMWLLVVLASIAGPVISFLSISKIDLYILIMSLLIFIFMYLCELRVKLSKEGIHYQFFPMHLKSHTIKFDEIDRFEELKYSPIGDYGGWGIRHRFKGKAYNVSGNRGVKIYLKSGRHILFGSQRSKEFEQVLNQFMKQ